MNIYRKLTLVSACLALVMFIISMIGDSPDRDARRVAELIGRQTERRLEKLERYIDEAVSSDKDELIHLPGLPDDMVIYRYRNDTLQSWCNQFSVINDDISVKLVFERLTNLKNNIVSPLADISEQLSYMNIGPKWYLMKSRTDDEGTKIIAGLEIQNTLLANNSHSDNGVNPTLKLPNRYSITPLGNSGGTTVTINGKPLFKVTYDMVQAYNFFDGSVLRWVSIALLALASVLFLAGHRSLKVYLAVVFLQMAILATSLIWGSQISGSSVIFSPTIYADGPIFHSLGSLLIVNTSITLLNVCTYLIRKRMRALTRKNIRTAKRDTAAYRACLTATALLSFLYIQYSLKSLILNSTITLDLYRWGHSAIYTIFVYASYTGIFFSILLIIQAIGLRFSRRSLIISAFVWALYLTSMSATLGFRKEQDRVAVWANCLTADRDLPVEMQLKSIEDDIASDRLIATFAAMENGSTMILNRISEYYLSRIRQNYNLNVLVIRQDDKSAVARFERAINLGTPISEGSRFLFITDSNGKSMYAGIFLFYNPGRGITHTMLEIEPDSNREDRGYSSVLGKRSHPGNINLPPIYSYAKYSGDRLVSYKGNYPYPTILSMDDRGQAGSMNISRKKGSIHFTNTISGQETIIISRPTRTIMTYFTSFSYLFLAVTALFLPFARIRRKRIFKVNYFRTRINIILFISSVLILVSMTVISVLFVYKRNEANMYNLMSSKILTVQALVSDHTRQAADWKSLATQKFAMELEKIGNTTKSDISLFTPEGKVFRSTNPEVFEKMVIGSRIDQEAFYNICYLHQRFFIKSGTIAGHRLWTLYAPVFNDAGEMIAIIGMPYTDRSFDFRREATIHAAMIINLFLILLIGSLLFSTREVNSMFAPLVIMGKKMKTANINNLETITYNREDEISSLIEAYNRMVQEVSDSSRQLAKAERDNAWSQMARQVAHEIKNPLTPIKLELQRLIRLKNNNNPAWEEKFDKVSSVILEHIDILTDTANEFSTFAKLYSEDPVLIDLDAILKDQLMIFDNKENVSISYLGMAGARVMAPKPQLIRVFVNLITNAIQAVESNEVSDQRKGRVLISLRNSTTEGCYDVVVEDNGPGVKEENLSRLFTPNFTTKSGGTGLGLAICRSIIAKCNGSISYKKSFALGGAAFTVTLPKFVPAQD